MHEITLRIPKRADAKGDFVLELYHGVGNQRGATPDATARISETQIPATEIAEMIDGLQAGSKPKHPFDQYGNRLYSLLHTGNVGQHLGNTLAGDVRLYLCMEDDVASIIPWELLHQQDLAFVHLLSRPLIRCGTLDFTIPESSVHGPWRIMLLVGAGPHDQISAAEELSELRRLFTIHDDVFDLEIVDAQSEHLAKSGDVEDRLRRFQPDFFHFIGHGINHLPSGKSCLMIHDRVTTLSWPWFASDIVSALSNARTRLRCAYLNACKTGVKLDVRSISEAFLRQSSLSVISLQADVDGTAARRCSLKFYELLADGNPIDRALQKGRVELGRADQRNPYLPMLTVKAPVDSILPPNEMDPQLVKSLNICSSLKRMRRQFVDRQLSRREVISSFFRSDTDPSRRYTAAFVQGPADAGKTWLGWWLVHVALRHAVTTHYVVPENAADWLNVLYAICRGGDEPEESAVSPGIPPDLVMQFQYETECSAKGIAPPFDNAPRGYATSPTSLADILNGGKVGPQFELNVMASFHHMLRKCAVDRPILLVFDHFRSSHKSFSDESFEALKRGLFDPIANDSEGPVRLLLILPAAASDQL
jgi:CHAT domain